MSYTTEEKIKLAGENSKDRLYEPKHNQKAIKVITVAAYMLCVSLAAIILSLYYVFIWDPTVKQIQPRVVHNCDKVVIPENIAIRLANTTEISAEKFYANIFKRLQKSRPFKGSSITTDGSSAENTNAVESGERVPKTVLSPTSPDYYKKYERPDNLHNSNNENEDDNENNEYEQSGYSINSNDTNINLDDQY